MASPIPLYVPNALDFLRRHFGVRIWLDDPEGEELGIEARDVSARDLEDVLRTYANPIKGHLYHEQRRRLQVCVGGPHNGQAYPSWRCRGERILFHDGTARWAVYEVGPDGRAWFVGIATSQAKGRRLPSRPSP